MIALVVDAAVVDNQRVHLFGREFRENVLEQINEMATDVAPQERFADIFLRSACERALNCAANVLRRIEQRAVNVEQVNRKGRDHLRQAEAVRRPADRAAFRPQV